MTNAEVEEKLAELEEWLSLMTARICGARTLDEFKSWQAMRLECLRREDESQQAATRD